ncbi:MAG: imidazole glycerol phosphate synthase subunit HisH [Flavobacteriales bacterium]|nr:imidazole glycerol phosphate synthase subunit HisH [Flavobacteriales bacterium]
MIAIVRYNAGNVKSVLNTVEKLGYEAVITEDKELIKNADKVIFPGVGEASSAMQHLKENQLDELILSLKQPVLGVCLGLQLMCKHSEEGNTDCLGIFDVEVKKFPSEDIIPHTGWNNFTELKTPLFEGIKLENDVYFVHSYYAELSKYTIGVCDYILPYSCALHRDNFYAVQFHPEKSGDVGARIMRNFLEM